MWIGERWLTARMGFRTAGRRGNDRRTWSTVTHTWSSLLLVLIVLQCSLFGVVRCGNETDECASLPCQNNGTCWDLVNEYVCNCTANYTGDNCQILITEGCELCENNATCNNYTTDEGYVTFNCSCLDGYSGRYCDELTDYCEDDPCLNGANCTSLWDSRTYECDCVPGYTGRNCETDMDECESHACQNGATCVDLVNEYACNCTEGWEGDLCDVDIKECNLTSPCVNGGQCIELDGGYECNCTGTGYEGEHCEEDIDECAADICENGATCENLPGSFECNCTEGYEGDTCDTPNCDLIECVNNATCSITEENTWECQCQEFYEGTYCEIPGPCLDEPCWNGNCTQEVESEEDYSYTCSCDPGWEGENCTEDIDECEVDEPCENGATCENIDGSYICHCVDGYTGDNCETDIDECASDPCVNGDCEDGVDGYICDCEPGYTGTHCETDIDECETDPDVCENGGTCHNEEPLYTCECAPDYLGSTCHSLDPCLPEEGEGGEEVEICQNGGNCTALVYDEHKNASVQCWCPEDWAGARCEIYEPRVSKSTDDDLIPLIAGCAVGGLILIIIIVVIALIMVARKKRATRGAYSPSRQEMSGSRVEMANQLKIPPEERLI